VESIRATENPSESRGSIWRDSVTHNKIWWNRAENVVKSDLFGVNLAKADLPAEFAGRPPPSNHLAGADFINRWPICAEPSLVSFESPERELIGHRTCSGSNLWAPIFMRGRMWFARWGGTNLSMRSCRIDFPRLRRRSKAIGDANQSCALVLFPHRGVRRQSAVSEWFHQPRRAADQFVGNCIRPSRNLLPIRVFILVGPLVLSGALLPATFHFSAFSCGAQWPRFQRFVRRRPSKMDGPGT